LNFFVNYRNAPKHEETKLLLAAGYSESIFSQCWLQCHTANKLCKFSENTTLATEGAEVQL